MQKNFILTARYNPETQAINTILTIPSEPLSPKEWETLTLIERRFPQRMEKFVLEMVSQKTFWHFQSEASLLLREIEQETNIEVILKTEGFDILAPR